ncbi:MAG: DUF362 domain-containing protein [Collinsella sp.]
MSGLIIDSEACIGCGRCVRACASGGIVVEGERPNRCARVTDGCILCGGCVDACPSTPSRSSAMRPRRGGPRRISRYLVFVQTDEHDRGPVAYELMARAASLRCPRCRLVALVGMSPESSLGTWSIGLRRCGRSSGLSRRASASNDAEVYARLICDLQPSASPRPFCTVRPPLAASWRRRCRPPADGLTADCTVLDGCGDGPCSRRARRLAAT